MKELVEMEKKTVESDKAEGGIRQAIMRAYQYYRRKNLCRDPRDYKSLIVEKASKILLKPECVWDDYSSCQSKAQAYFQFITGYARNICNELLGARDVKLRNIELECSRLMHILPEIHPWTEENESIIFVDGAYMDICEEASEETGYSYQYRYEKPDIIQEAMGQIQEIGEVYHLGCKIEKEIAAGIRLKSEELYNNFASKKRICLLFIAEEACPVRVRYISGEGGGYRDSGYNDSSRTEKWVTYVKDWPELRRLLGYR